MKTKFIAEMVGTMVLVLMGCGAAVILLRQNRLAVLFPFTGINTDQHNAERKQGYRYHTKC